MKLFQLMLVSCVLDCHMFAGDGFVTRHDVNQLCWRFISILLWFEPAFAVLTFFNDRCFRHIPYSRRRGEEGHPCYHQGSSLQGCQRVNLQDRQGEMSVLNHFT